MPLVKPLASQELDIEIKAVLSAYMSRAGTCKTKMGSSIGISPSGFCNKFKSPETFTIGELRRAYDFLKVPKEERVGL